MTFGQHPAHLRLEQKIDPSAAIGQRRLSVAKIVAAMGQPAFLGLRGAERIKAQLFDALGTYLHTKGRDASERAKLAAAMVEYARLCLTAGTPRDLEQAVSFLDEAAGLYREIGRLEEAEKAISMKPRIDEKE